MRTQLLLFLACSLCCPSDAFAAAAAPVKAEADAVTVTASGLRQEDAQAIADVLSAARRAYVEHLALPMPDSIACDATVAADRPARLFTDGASRVTLSLPAAAKLKRPATSGIFNLYGMCHELGHVAMYRILKEHAVLTTAGAEGWAHYAGSVVVDRVYEAKGEAVWKPDPYDYRADGTARLKRQLAASAKGDDVARGAGAWLALAGILGDKRFADLFAAWQEAIVKSKGDAGVAAVDPELTLRPALLALDPSKKAELEKWWAEAGALLFRKLERSEQVATPLPAGTKLSGKPQVVTNDDGTAEGMRSIAGGGHARRFAAPSGDWYLAGIQVHAGRYGPMKAPDTTFTLTLCDAQMNPIASWTYPYASVPRGQPRWVKLDLPKPVKLPPGELHLSLAFNPTAQSGVFISFDDSTTGASATSLPGTGTRTLAKGDWMIRPILDQPEEGDALKGR